MASPEETISKAVDHITRLIRHYQIEPYEWLMMKRESPELWAKIGELEWLGPQMPDETQRACRSLVLCYERLLMRRDVKRGVKHAA